MAPKDAGLRADGDLSRVDIEGRWLVQAKDQQIAGLRDRLTRTEDALVVADAAVLQVRAMLGEERRWRVTLQARVEELQAELVAASEPPPGPPPDDVLVDGPLAASGL